MVKISPENCPVSEQEYVRNRLESIAMWLQGRSNTGWALRYRHSEQMIDNANFIRQLLKNLETATPTTELIAALNKAADEIAREGPESVPEWEAACRNAAMALSYWSKPNG